MRAVELVRDKKSPLDVMLRNMWFWDEAAENMRQRIDDTIVELTNSGADEETMKKMQELMGKFFAARDKAQICAVDAAPYVHAKFQSIMLKNEQEKARVVTLVLPPTPQVAGTQTEDRSYRDGYGDPVPIRKT